MPHRLRIRPLLLLVAILTAIPLSANAQDKTLDDLPLYRTPVGYDDPATDRGGPSVPDGLGWIERVYPRSIVLAPKPAWEKPTVFFMTNYGGIDTVHELARRFPMNVVHCHARSGNEFPGREVFDTLLEKAGEVDCFVISRMGTRTIPADVQYRILSRVRDGAGLVVIDIFDASKTFSRKYLGIEAEEKGKRLVPGIPYEGLRQSEYSYREYVPTFNYWWSSGMLYADPEAKPYDYRSVIAGPFGKGRTVWISTGTHWARASRRGRALLPHIELTRDMWVEADYHYSHTAKAILKACRIEQPARIAAMAPAGPQKTAGPVTVTVATPNGAAFEGVLRWQVRDTWGQVTQKGQQKIALDPAGDDEGENPAAGTIDIDNLAAFDAGRNFVDVWIETAGGETADWGSTFIEVDRGVPAPAITNNHPNGAPRGRDLQGSVTLRQTPENARLRIVLEDRHWREVGRTEWDIPAGNVVAPWRFPAKGLDGQIWRLKVHLLDNEGRILARNHASIAAPHTPETRGGFHPLCTCTGSANPEQAARREYLRRLGFLANRPYWIGSDGQAENQAWTDMQSHPFSIRVDHPRNTFRSDRITDWEGPLIKRDIDRVFPWLTAQMSAFGMRGVNATDDCSPGRKLPLGSYTMREFHEWLKKEYGDFEAVSAAWGWTPEVVPHAGDELPWDAYVIIEFHEWLKNKYGSLQGVAKAWGIKARGFGSMHTFGSIQPEMVANQAAKGNAKPQQDAAAFMKEYAARGETPDPFGRIHAHSIKAAHDAGHLGPWIDAQRFMGHQWIEHIRWVRDAVESVNPNAYVGSDASYYVGTFPIVASEFRYIAPYYRDRKTKVAVSRGRMRQDGDYGGCLGAYGDKPQTMVNRRSKIWNILFAGGTGYYYWSFVSGGMREDLTLSDKHARYQCEVTEEIMGGIGELFTGCRRIFHPVAILHSRESYLCDGVRKPEEAIASQQNSIGAFQYILEDHGVNPHTIVPEELEAGWLDRNETRLLVLPACTSLSDKSVTTIRAFAERGGVVVADVRPGGQRPNGQPRSDNPLDEVFGIAFDTGGKTFRVKGQMKGNPYANGAELSFGPALADPRIAPDGASAGAAVGPEDKPDKRAAALLGHDVGKGRAYLFNASFASYSTYRTEAGEHWSAWHRTFAPVVAAAGLKPRFAVTSRGKTTSGFEISPFVNGSGYLLGVEDLGTGDFAGKLRPFTVTLPRAFHVYDIRAGKYVGHTDALNAEVPRRGHRAYALMPYRVTSVTVDPDRPTATGGETVTLSVDLAIDGAQTRDLHAVRLEAVSPDGERFFPFRRVVRMPDGGPLEIPLTFAHNDPPGTWTFVATDINTGARKAVSVTLER